MLFRSGDVWTDLSTAFSEVQWGQYVLLGTLRFNMYSQAWIGENHIMKIDNGDFCDCAIVVDGNFWTIDADKKKFTFNCTTSCDCEWTPASSETWGMIKTLY